MTERSVKGWLSLSQLTKNSTKQIVNFYLFLYNEYITKGGGTMFLTQSNQIRGLSKEQFSQLRELCHYAKNLYNVGLYNVRQPY